MAIFGTKIGSFLGDFGPFLGRSRAIFGSLWDHFGIILGTFWCRFDPILGLFRIIFWAFLAHFCAIFIGILRFLIMVSEVGPTLSKMMQEKAKKMQISPKFTKIMQNSTKTSFFPPPIRHMFLLKKKRRKSIVWGTHFSSNPPGRFEGVGYFPFGVPFSFGVRPKKKRLDAFPKTRRLFSAFSAPVV